MMLDYIFGLFAWMPTPVAIVAEGVVAIFMLWTIIKIVEVVVPFF